MVGCGDGSDDGSIEIAKPQYGAEWPFTVESGRLRCDPGSHVVFVADGTAYAINGSAKGAAARNGYANVDAIWATQSMGKPERTASAPLEQRQRLFGELVKCESGSPSDSDVERCKAGVRRRAKLSEEDESLISTEAVMLARGHR